MWIWGSPLIKDNIIEYNEAYNRGGGIYSSSGPIPTIEGNRILHNRARDGGGICFYDGFVRGNVIMYNVATFGEGSYIVGYGGGIAVSGYDPLIEDNIISYNTAMLEGGGILYCALYGKIAGNTITGNVAGGGTYQGQKRSGGGIEFVAFGKTTDTLLMNNVICGNQSEETGGGLSLLGLIGNGDVKVTILNCTLSGNEAQVGDGIYCNSESQLVITNSIIYGNGTEEIHLDSPDVTVEYSDVQHGWPGTGNILLPPRFADKDGGDFHILYHSPCRDSGTNGAPGLARLDFEGDPRIAYGTVDMGADEFYTHLYFTGDAVPGGNVEIKLIGMPGTAPVGLFIGAGVLENPWPTPWGDWYLDYPVSGPILLSPIPGDGLAVFAGSLPAVPPGPYMIPLQGFVGDLLTNLCVLDVE